MRDAVFIVMNDLKNRLFLFFFFGLAAVCLEAALRDVSPQTGSVIFIHPDGTSLNHWAFLRLVEVGADGMTRWDEIERMGLYRGHLLDSVASSSHGGATAHAYGKKVLKDSYGMMGQEPLEALSGAPHSIAMEAHGAGIPTGIVNSGHIGEPGTGVFAASHPTRRGVNEIAEKIVASGMPLILAGGERYFLPQGTVGFHGGEGVREDGLNLIERAQELGYTVVFDKAQLMALDPAMTGKVLGVFADGNTFNDRPEEVLAEAGLPLYNPGTPSIGDMTAFALRFLSARGERFFLVAEEEGTDNFANNGNAPGTLEALRRADRAIGHALDFLQLHPETLLVTAADSNAGNPAIMAIDKPEEYAVPLPVKTRQGAPLDGQSGPEGLPFVTAPDAFGRVHYFGIAWPDYGDYHGGIVARAQGMNSHLLPAHVQNTDIYRLMYATLFGRILE